MDGYKTSGPAHKIAAGVAHAKELHTGTEERPADPAAASAHIQSEVAPAQKELISQLMPHFKSKMTSKDIAPILKQLGSPPKGGWSPQDIDQAKAYAASTVIADWLKPTTDRTKAGGRSALMSATAQKVAHHGAAEGTSPDEAHPFDPEHPQHPATFPEQLYALSKKLHGRVAKGAEAQRQKEAGIRSVQGDIIQGVGTGAPEGETGELTPKEAAAEKRRKAVQRAAVGGIARAREVQAPAIDPAKQQAAGEAIGKLAMGPDYDPSKHGSMTHEDATKAYQARALARADALISSHLGTDADGNRVHTKQGPLGVQSVEVDGQTYNIDMGEWLKTAIGDPNNDATNGRWVGGERGDARYEPYMFRRGTKTAYFQNLFPDFARVISGKSKGGLGQKPKFDGLMKRALDEFHGNEEMGFRKGQESRADYGERIRQYGEELRDVHKHPALQPTTIPVPHPMPSVGNVTVDPVKLMADWMGAKSPSKDGRNALAQQIPEWEHIHKTVTSLKGQDQKSHDFYPFWEAVMRGHSKGKTVGGVLRRAEHAIRRHHPDWHSQHPGITGFTRSQGARAREHDQEQNQHIVEDEMLDLFRGWLEEHVQLHPGRLDIIINELRTHRDEHVFNESLSLRSFS
jgi:hypothetical protein